MNSDVGMYNVKNCETRSYFSNDIKRTRTIMCNPLPCREALRMVVLVHVSLIELLRELLVSTVFASLHRHSYDFCTCFTHFALNKKQRKMTIFLTGRSSNGGILSR